MKDMPRDHINHLLVKYIKLFSDTYFRRAVLIGILVVLIAGVATGFAKQYTNEAIGNPVGDLLLDHLPAFPLFGFLIWGTLAISFSILAFMLLKPEYLPASLKSVALLYFIRAVFISLTHLKVSPEKVVGVTEYGQLADLLYNGNDLFFSGHVALPFLAALIFWEYKWIRNYLLLAAVAFGVAVLLSRLHYSIDVFAAPFITFAIFSMSQLFFKRDYAYIRRIMNN